MQNSSGIRLMHLVDNHLLEIVGNERLNDKKICLYGTGEYWTAFEHSAYQLCQIFPDSCYTFIANHPNYPYTVVAAIISDNQLRTYGRKMKFQRNEPEYKEILTTLLIRQNYNLWHKNEISSLMD